MRRGGHRDDAGMVTAELALVVPTVLLVLACCLTGLGLAADQVRCLDAARVATRAASRGEDPAQAVDLARRLAPEGSVVQVRVGGGAVTVSVTAPARDGLLPLPAASAAVTGDLEPVVRGGP